MLQVLELGKNYISHADSLQSSNNKLSNLQELYLYLNELRSLPNNLSFPQLKIVNLNRNQDLASISFGYCPSLEQLTASYCALKDFGGAGAGGQEPTGNLSLCPNLTTLDISFNKIEKLETFLRAFKDNKKLTSVIMNDNVFNFNIQADI